jgi:hypothetical protein
MKRICGSIASMDEKKRTTKTEKPILAQFGCWLWKWPVIKPIDFRKPSSDG